MMDCKFFREDLVCEILFDYLLGVWMHGQIRGGPRGLAPTFFISIVKKKNESRTS